MNITEIKELLAGAPTAEQLATLAADERKGVQKLLAAYNKRLEKAAAEKAAQVLKLDYCGVDLLYGEDGPVLCEVNSNAFFEGLEAATGVNVAKLYAEYIVGTMGGR